MQENWHIYHCQFDLEVISRSQNKGAVIIKVSVTSCNSQSVHFGPVDERTCTDCVCVCVCRGEKKQSPQSHSHESDDDNEPSHHSDSSDAASSSDSVSNERQQQDTIGCQVDVDRLYSDQSQDGQALSRTTIIRDIVKVITALCTALLWWKCAHVWAGGMERRNKLKGSGMNGNGGEMKCMSLRHDWGSGVAKGDWLIQAANCNG